MIVASDMLFDFNHKLGSGQGRERAADTADTLTLLVATSGDIEGSVTRNGPLLLAFLF